MPTGATMKQHHKQKGWMPRRKKKQDRQRQKTLVISAMERYDKPLEKGHLPSHCHLLQVSWLYAVVWPTLQLNSVLDWKASLAVSRADGITRGGSRADPEQVWKAYQRPVKTVGCMSPHGESAAVHSLLFLFLTFPLSFLSLSLPLSLCSPIFHLPLPDSKICSCAHLNQSNKGCRFRLIKVCLRDMFSHERRKHFLAF